MGGDDGDERRFLRMERRAGRFVASVFVCSKQPGAAGMEEGGHGTSESLAGVCVE